MWNDLIRLSCLKQNAGEGAKIVNLRYIKYG
jgi:hypothetical protein